MNSKVDAFLERAQRWQREMKELRKIALAKTDGGGFGRRIAGPSSALPDAEGIGMGQPEQG